MLRKLFMLCLAFLASAALADEASVKKRVQDKFPPSKIQSVVKTPYDGLYEVYMDGTIVYTNEQVTFVITHGEIIDTKTNARVTEQRMRKLTALKLQDLPPLTSAIRRVKGDGKRTLMIFSDPMCPYCKQLEREVAKLNNVTTYLWLYPVESRFPGSTELAKSIWCSRDRGRAWDEWMLKGTRPSAPANCANPIEDIDKAGTKLGINITPTLIFADGAPINGMLPAADIDRLLNQSPK